jgi:flavin-dependent dehydrogenase
MDACDALVVGGGPAGSTCAWKLREAGLDVVIVDKAFFPRDKVCAGWITPQVIQDLRLDPDEYRAGRTFQPISGFRVGLIGGDDAVEARYEQPVSFGIRRCEFDGYLLGRSRARLMAGTPITSIRHEAGRWLLNEAVAAPVLVGAGGHFCPVARLLSGPAGRAPLITAQEVEFAIDPADGASFATAPEHPELYFRADLTGYGWCFRKQDHLNIGFGRIGSRGLGAETAGFIDFLKARRRIPAERSWRPRGHAYLLAGGPRRRAVGDGVMLAGDAAGLAYPQSGEGIRPAIESGLLAASTILEAGGRYDRGRLEPYERELHKRFDTSPRARLLSRAIPGPLAAALAPRLMEIPWFVRHVLLDRWFLRAHERALSVDR